MCKIKKWIAIMLAIVMVLNTIHTENFVFAANNQGMTGYKMIVSYNEDHSQAFIKGDTSEVYEGITITKVIAPDQTELDIQNLQYIVKENGTYTFTLQYEEQHNVENQIESGSSSGSAIEVTQEPEEMLQKSQEIEVIVDGIKKNDDMPVLLSKLLEEGRVVNKRLQAKAYEKETYTYLGDVDIALGTVEHSIPEATNYEFLKDKYTKQEAKLYIKQKNQNAKLEISYITYIDFGEDIERTGYYYTLKSENNDDTYSQIAFKLLENDTILEVHYPLLNPLWLKTVSIDWSTLPSDIQLNVNGKLLKNEADMQTVSISQGSEVTIQTRHLNKYGVFQVYYMNEGEEKKNPISVMKQDGDQEYIRDEKGYILRKHSFLMPPNSVVLTFHVQEWERNSHKFALFDSTSDNNQINKLRAGEVKIETVSGADGEWKPWYYSLAWNDAAKDISIGELFRIHSHYYNYIDENTLKQQEVSFGKSNNEVNWKKSDIQYLNNSRINKGNSQVGAAIGSYIGSSNLTFAYQAGFYYADSGDKPIQLLYGAAEYLRYSYWNNSGMMNTSNDAQAPSSYTDYIPLYINGEKENATPRSYTTSDGATIIIQRVANKQVDYNLRHHNERDTITLYCYKIQVIGATNDFSIETISKNQMHATMEMDYDTTYIKDVSIGMYQRNSIYNKHYVKMNAEEQKTFLEESSKKEKPDFKEGAGQATNDDKVGQAGWYQIKKGFTYYNKWMQGGNDKYQDQADPWLRIVVEDGYTPPAPRVYWSKGGITGTFFPKKENPASYLYFQFEMADHFKEDSKSYVAYYYRMYSNGWPSDDVDKTLQIKFESKSMQFTGDFYDTEGTLNNELADQTYALDGNLLTDGEDADPVGILSMKTPTMDDFAGWDFYMYPDKEQAKKDKNNESAIAKIDKTYQIGDKVVYRNLYEEIKENVEKEGYQSLYIKAVPHQNKDGGYINGKVTIYKQTSAKTTVDSTQRPIGQKGYTEQRKDEHKVMIGQKPRIAITKPTLIENGITYIANKYYVRNAPIVEKNSNGDTEITAVFYDQKVQVEYRIEGSTTSYQDTNTYTMGLHNNSKIKLKPYIEVRTALGVKKPPEGKKFIGWKIIVGEKTIGDRNGACFVQSTPYDFASSLNSAVYPEDSNIFYDSVFQTQKIVFEAQYKINDDPPVLTVPDVLVFNVGDTFDPKDPNIVQKNGVKLSVSDKEDEDISLQDVKVTENIPREGKELFTIDNTNRLTKAGTYEVIYSVTDSGQNIVTKNMKVKVHSLPYFEPNDAPTVYLRTKETNLKNYVYQNLKAYYLKASDIIGQEPEKTELKNSFEGGNEKDGGLFVQTFVNVKNPSEPVDNVNEVGKYKMDYKAITPTNGQAKISRYGYVRSHPEVDEVEPIIISKNEDQKFTNWEDFLKQYEKKLKIRASVKTPDENGTIKMEVVDNFKILTSITDIPFGNLEEKKSYTVQFKVIDNKSPYPTRETEAFFTISVAKGLPPKIELPKDYDNERVVEDKVMVKDKERTEDFLQALLDEAKIYDVDDKGTHYYGKPSESNEVGKRYGIKEKGIVSICKEIGDSQREIIYEKEKETSIQALDQKIRTMYDTVGIYEVTYYAIDGDANEINAIRKIKVASQTKFVEKVGNPAGKNDTPIQVVNVRTASMKQPASGVIAYHIDPNGEVHQQSALPHGKVDFSTIGKQEILFTTTHHYNILPGTNGRPRDPDRIEKIYLIHGRIEFHGLKDQMYFKDETVDVMDGVTATFEKANEDGTIVKEAAAVTMSAIVYEEKWIQAMHTFNQKAFHKRATYREESEAQKVTVEYEATDEVTGVEEGKTEIGTRTLTFIDFPEIVAKDSIFVRAQATEDEIIGELNAGAYIDLFDKIADLTKDIKYDFTKIKDGILKLEVSYTLSSGRTRTAKKEVTVYFLDSLPIIKQQQLHARLNQQLDLMKDVSATYVQAQEDGRLVVTGAALRVVDILDQEGNHIKQEEINQKVGRYIVTYKAENKSHGCSTAQRYVYIHGLIDAKVVPLELEKTSVNEVKQYDVARLVSLGAIKANVLHTKSDGQIETVQLGSDCMTLLETNLDTSKVGTYSIRMRIQDEMAPKIERDVDIPIKVVAQGQNNTGHTNDSDSVYHPSSDSNKEGTEEEIPKEDSSEEEHSEEIPKEEVEDKELEDTVTKDKVVEEEKQQKEVPFPQYNPSVTIKTEGNERNSFQGNTTHVPMKRIKSLVVETEDKIHKKLLWTMLIGSVVAMLLFLLRKYRKRK